jgi:hypothetical protein
MQESPDPSFDAALMRGMKFRTLVTPSQQQDARERLLALAAEQTMLPPLDATEVSLPVQEEVYTVSQRTLRDHAYTVGQHTLRILQLLITDSSMYERARLPSPLFYEYYNPHGRYAYTIIRMSA